MDIEEKLKLENETLTLKREYKYALENLNRSKTDTAEIITTKERVTNEVNERNKELTKILNQISDEKLQWALEKQREYDEIAQKKSDAENVLKRKAELNDQEERIRVLEASEIDARNEARRLELKNETTKLDFENREKQIKVLQKIVDDDRSKFEKDKENFKEEVIKIIKKVENL